MGIAADGTQFHPPPIGVATVTDPDTRQVIITREGTPSPLLSIPYSITTLYSLLLHFLIYSIIH